jgi:uncharacterized protein YbbC (DUF1343 family)
MDVVCGSDTIRKAIESGDSLENIQAAWTPRLEEFKRSRTEFLSY